MSSSCQVRVGVRVRPLTSKEIQHGGKSTLTVSPPSSISMGQRQFTYDTVFDANIDQMELYNNISKPLLTSFVDGYNATIMAYGQTGSGKTYTMGSEAQLESESSFNVGLIPRFLSDFFLTLQQKKALSDAADGNSPALLDYKMTASFLEVYGEDVFDLLDVERSSLPLREHSDGGIVVAGLTSRPISSPAEALQVLHEGTMNRTTAATLMNLTSSRSHAVFTIHLSQVLRSPNYDGVDITTTSKFTFVDLAGSERLKKTGAEGERAKEGIKINEGLLALGNVINALADEQRITKEKKIYVPYRQSKLTRLLQDALGGNSQTLFLACVSPSDTNASETLSTMHYANRARNIRNAPTKNVDATAAELHRLNTLTRILQNELIKLRFQDDVHEEKKIGEIDDSLMTRADVGEYLNLIHQKAASVSVSVSTELSGVFKPSPVPPNVEFHTHSAPPRPKREKKVIQALDKTISERFDGSFLVDVNPDEDMAILDQLLELQQHDHEYDKERKIEDEQLKKMDGELEQEETMLLQLREKLKVYHSLKTKYEELMAEVQQLEVEKAGLADQLEKAKADPSTGNSAAIKRQLERVELSLSRARRETLSHRQKYRTAEDQAKKCRVLERKIGELKQAKISLVKKQKEAAARYKETTERKTKELLALRRKEKASDLRMSKLNTEIQHHKSNLEKRKRYCIKLSEKLKQTEAHLTKLLSMRQRDLLDRTSSVYGGGKKGIHDAGERQDNQNSKSFNPSEEELNSQKYIFNKLIMKKVNQALLQHQYDERVAVYSDTMRLVISEVKLLASARQKFEDEGSEESKSALHDLEANVGDLEVKLELLGSEVNEIRSKMPQYSENSIRDNDEGIRNLIQSMSNKALRTFTMDLFSKLVNSETKTRTQTESIERKDAALLSFESEVEGLNYKISCLTKDIASRRALVESGEDPFEIVEQTTLERDGLRQDLYRLKEEFEGLASQIDDLKRELQNSKRETEESKELLALAEASLAKQGDQIESKEALEQLQHVWDILGTDAAAREQHSREIQSSLKDTCAMKLKEAQSMREKIESEIQQLSSDLKSMQRALGMPSDVGRQPGSKLVDTLQSLQENVQRVKTPFDYALARRERLVNDTTELCGTLGLSNDQLQVNLKTLLSHSEKTSTSSSDLGRQKRASMMKDIKTMVNALSSFETATHRQVITENGEHDIDREQKDWYLSLPANSLENNFLSSCENEVAKLRVQKSEMLARRRELELNISGLIKDMHLNVHDSLVVMENSVKQAGKKTLKWWDSERARTILKAIICSEELFSSPSDEQHLQLIHESLSKVAACRGALSTALRTIVERAQETLLNIVGRELDASEAYASFNDALFQLPALSRDLSLACISEMEALVIGVDAMTQSEVEALTVVWEALKVSSGDRRDFWGSVEHSLSGEDKSNPFDSFDNHSIAVKEDWVGAAVEKGVKVYHELDKKLNKLNGIHKEVERLRSRQDTKSQILSLDSEIRILNAKLQDFEDLKCNKQRLLTKKSSGTTLLKEERFRKQMQGKFVSKLGKLTSLLRSWEKRENRSFDASLLSEDVQKLLNEPDKMENWVAKRTNLMPLRTVKAKPPARNRTTEASSTKNAVSSRYKSGLTPPRKRVAKENQPLQNANRKGDANSTAVLRGKQKRTRGNTDAASGVVKASQTTEQKPSKRLRRKDTTLPPFGRILSEVSSPQSNVKANTQR